MKSARAAKRHPGRLFADLYEGDPVFDAHHYASTGAPFVVLKASQGSGHTDSRHHLRSQLAHEVGLPVGHYHYLTESTPSAQAALLWDVAKRAWAPRDFLIVDIERGAGLTDPHDQLTRFDQHLHEITGRTCIGYSEDSYLEEHLLEVKSRKWWVADYGASPNKHLPFGQELWAHQFTGTGRINGTEGETDLSVLVAPSAIRWWDR